MPEPIRLPFPPSVWKLYKGHGASKEKSDEYKAWRTEAGFMLNIQRPKRHVGCVASRIVAVPPDNRHRDGDNIKKACYDLLKDHCVIQDDSNRFVKDLRLVWLDKHEQHGVYIFLDEWTPKDIPEWAKEPWNRAGTGVAGCAA